MGGQILRKEVESEQLSLKKSRDSLQAQAGELFANSQCRWIFQTNNLPDFPYGTEPLPLNDTNRVARLQRQLVAIELVRAWAQIHGIKLQYWPELTFFVGGPSVYQRVNGENQFWSASSATATANFFWTIDTRGYVAMQLRQTRREQELELARLQLDSQDLISRLLAAQRLVGELQEQIQQLDRLIAALDNIPQDLDVTSIVQSMESNRSLRLQRFKLRRDLAEVNTLFWFVDEQRWPAGT